MPLRQLWQMDGDCQIMPICIEDYFEDEVNICCSAQKDGDDVSGGMKVTTTHPARVGRGKERNH